MDGAVMSLDEIKTLAATPNMDTLIAKMMGSLNSPISSLARLLATIADGGVEIADLIAEQRGFLIRPYEEARIKSVYRLNDYEMKYPDVKVERNTHKVTIENVQSKTERKRIRVKTK